MKTVIEMAREAGWDDHHAEFDTRIERFAAFVRADEREACAKVAEKLTWADNKGVASAIRAQQGLDYEPEQMTTTENNGGKTGWPPGLLQDDCKGLSKWLANKPDAKRRVREALAEQPAQQEEEHMTWVFLTDKKRNEISRKSGPYVADSFAPHEAEVRRLNPRDNWVGLTDEERDPIRSKFVGKLHYVADVLAEFEAKLKEKNATFPPAVPDAIHHTDTSETLEYIRGWNDCRQLMLEMRKP